MVKVVKGTQNTNLWLKSRTVAFFTIEFYPRYNIWSDHLTPMSPRITEAVCCSDDPLPVDKTYHFSVNCLYRFRTSIIHHQSHLWISFRFINQFLLIRLAPHRNLENIPAGSSTMKTNQGFALWTSSPPGQHVSCKKRKKGVCNAKFAFLTSSPPVQHMICQNKQTNKRGGFAMQTLHSVHSLPLVNNVMHTSLSAWRRALPKGKVSGIHFQC